MDESSKRWFAGAWKNKVAAGFTTSASQSGDKLNTLLQLMVFANQHAMIWVGLDLMPGNNNSKGSVDSLNRLGSFSGAMAQANADQVPRRCARATSGRLPVLAPALPRLRWHCSAGAPDRSRCRPLLALPASAYSGGDFDGGGAACTHRSRISMC